MDKIKIQLFYFYPILQFMKSNSLTFSFSPSGEQKITVCAWCDNSKAVSFLTWLDIEDLGCEISHGICDKHAQELMHRHPRDYNLSGKDISHMIQIEL